MKKIFLPLLGCLSAMSFAQTATLVSDVNPGDENGLNRLEYKSAKINNTIVFTAKTPGTGSELFAIKNDTVELIKDIVEGAESSSPSRFVNFKDEIYFTVKNTAGKYDIYKTNGTTEGTMVAINLNQTERIKVMFVAKNGKLYFNTNSSLYVSNGTDATTSKIITTGYIDLLESSNYGSTYITNYKDGVAFYGNSNNIFTIYYHNGTEVKVLYSFEADSFSSLLGPVTCSTGLVYGIQDSFNKNLVKTYHLSDDSVSTELKIDNQSIDLQRIYDVNGEYFILKPFKKGIYSYNGTKFELLSGPGANYSLTQGENIPHAIIGDKVFFLGEKSWFDDKYYVSDGTAVGTKYIKTPESAFPAYTLLTEGNMVYMIQGISNGFDAFVIQVDIEQGNSYTLFEQEDGPVETYQMELAGIVNNDVYFFGNLDYDYGYEVYKTKKTETPSGASAQSNDYSIKLFPNPTQGQISFEWTNDSDIVTISDVTGRTIFSRKVLFGNNNFDLTSLENGIYTLSISNEESSFSERLIINK